MDEMRVALVVIAAVFLTPSAQACSCKVGTIEEQFEKATAVFRILVTGTELRPTSDILESGLLPDGELSDEDIAEILEEMPKYVRVSFTLIETYKSESSIPDHLLEMTFAPGNCGLGLVAGVEYVIFSGGDAIEFATYCTGSFGFFNADGAEIKPDLDRLRELAR